MTMVVAMKLKAAGPVATQGANHDVARATSGFDAALLETGVTSAAARPSEDAGARKPRKDVSGPVELREQKRLEEGAAPADRPRDAGPPPIGQAPMIDAEIAASLISIVTIAVSAPSPSISTAAPALPHRSTRAAQPRSAAEAAPKAGAMMPMFKAEPNATGGRNDQAMPGEADNTGGMLRSAFVGAKPTRHLAPVAAQSLPERLAMKPGGLGEPSSKPMATTHEQAAAAAPETSQDAPEADGPAGQIAHVVARAAVKAAAVVEQSGMTAPGQPEARIVAPTQMLKVELSPAGLGAVVVSMRLHGGALDLRLSMTNAQGVVAVERERDALVARLKGGGYVVETLVIAQDKPASNIQSSEKGEGPTTRDAEAQPEQGRPSGQENSRRQQHVPVRDAKPHRPDRGDGLYL